MQMTIVQVALSISFAGASPNTTIHTQYICNVKWFQHFAQRNHHVTLSSYTPHWWYQDWIDDLEAQVFFIKFITDLKQKRSELLDHQPRDKTRYQPWSRCPSHCHVTVWWKAARHSKTTFSVTNKQTENKVNARTYKLKLKSKGAVM